MRIQSTLPSLIVGFDTETTGLDTSEDEVISYGFAVFRNGRFVADESGQIFAATEKEIHPKAQAIHGLTLAELKTRRSEWGGPFTATEGLHNALRRLELFREQNAVFVGAFPKFDFDMIESMSRRYLMNFTEWSRDILEDFRYPEYFTQRESFVEALPISHQEELLVVNSAMPRVPSTTRIQRKNLAVDILMSSKKPWPRIIDVCAFDRLHWPDMSRRRGLGALCDFYGVEPGRHDALQDARAAVEVWMRQMQLRFSEYSSTQ